MYIILVCIYVCVLCVCMYVSYVSTCVMYVRVLYTFLDEQVVSLPTSANVKSLLYQSRFSLFPTIQIFINTDYTNKHKIHFCVFSENHKHIIFFLHTQIMTTTNIANFALGPAYDWLTNLSEQVFNTGSLG